MLYLLTEIFVYLIIAFLLGLLFGWAITHLVLTHKLSRMEALARINYMSLEKELNDAKSALKYSQSGHFDVGKEDSTKKGDDLKIISGIGPVLEKHLNKMGIHTYKQIANLSQKDLEWLSLTIEAFPDRIEREHWVDQAKKLVAGQETTTGERT